MARGLIEKYKGTSGDISPSTVAIIILVNCICKYVDTYLHINMNNVQVWEMILAPEAFGFLSAVCITF